jgi:hypothetical protein
MHQYADVTDFVDVVAIDFDVIDVSGERCNAAEQADGAGASLDLFNFVELTERYPILTIHRPERVNVGTCDLRPILIRLSG